MYIKNSFANAHQHFKASEKYFTSHYCAWWGYPPVLFSNLSPVVWKMIRAKLFPLERVTRFRTKKEIDNYFCFRLKQLQNSGLWVARNAPLVIDLLATDKSWYFVQPHPIILNCFQYHFKGQYKGVWAWLLCKEQNLQNGQLSMSIQK